MPRRRPEVFVSATSSDLRSCRQLVKEGLLTLGCVPVEQTNFPPDHRLVRDALRAKIAACDAVIHLAGECYGAEPVRAGLSTARRSYTQIEYDLARELRKPVYVFLCDPHFAYDPHAAEDVERQRLQQAHRAALAATESLRCEVGSRADLALRVRELQTSVEQLSGELRRTRSLLGVGVVAGLAIFTLLGAGLWWQQSRASRTEGRVAGLEAELNLRRRYTVAVIEAYQQLQDEATARALPQAERINRALATVALREKTTPAELRNALGLFVTGVRANPRGDGPDRALADFVQSELSGATVALSRAAVAPRNPVTKPPSTPAPTPPPAPASPFPSAPAVAAAPPDAGSVTPPNYRPAALDQAAIRTRMMQRLPALGAVLARGSVGESNVGFLQILQTVAADERRLVDDENADRRDVYASLAAQTSSDPVAVGRTRAKQLAELSRRGTWLQNTAGEWKQKP